MSSPRPQRPWWMATVVLATVGLLAVAALAGWALNRPGPTAGDGTAALRDPAGASPTPTGPAPMPSLRATARPAAPTDVTSAPSAPPPVRLRIPALGVDATVRPVGVQQDGAMVIPAAPTSVGWYRFGRAPGDAVGHTVIAGHVATEEDGPGALAPLGAAEKGMRVEVTTADGATVRYVVSGRSLIHKKALPVDEIFARTGAPRLVLVTCGGEYIPALRSHRDNVVVTAVPVR